MSVLSRVLVVLGTLLSVLALLGAWADRQLLDTGDWTQTSAALLRDDAVRDALADRISADLADGSRVTAQLQEALPPRLAPLAEPAGGVVREAVHRLTRRLLASPQVQELWVDANRVTHEQFVALAEGEGVQVADGAVVLDLRPLEDRIAQAAGLELDPERVGPGGRIVVMDGGQLEAVQRGADVLGVLGWAFAVLAVGCFAAAILLARADRRRAVVAIALGVAGAGLAVLVVRRVAGEQIVSALTQDGAGAPAALAVWRIGTGLLADLAVVFVVVGLVGLAGAWLAGPGRWGTRARSVLSPVLVDRPEVAFGVALAFFVAVVAWGPLDALRRPLAIVVLAALLLVGVELLRRAARTHRGEDPAAAPSVRSSPSDVRRGPHPG